MYKNYQNKSVIQKLLFSPFIINKSHAKKIAYIAITSAILIVANVFEVPFIDAQYSLTIATSAIAGVLLGPISGFASCMVADAIGFLINSKGGIYMPWVGLAVAVTALMAGLIYHFINFKFKGGSIVKLVLICLASFTLGTILINSTGFYFYNYYMGFSTTVIDYVAKTFGTNVTYIAYVIYRLFFKGLIFSCLVNYALILIVTPIIVNVPLFKKDLE